MNYTDWRFTLLTTGGTFDKDYAVGLGVQDLHIGDPVAPAILQKMFHNDDRIFDHQEVFRKDSMDIIDSDRELIREYARHARTNHVLITHGTDTMVKTAQALKADARLRDKRIVLVGSSKPARWGKSDAPRCLAFALAVLMMSSEPGVIIAMDGIHDDPDNCRKNEAGVFRSFS